MQGSLAAGARGVLAAVGSSVIFAGVFFITPMLVPTSAEGLWAIRCLLTIPLVLLVLLAGRQRELIVGIWHRILARPLIILPLIASALLLALQLWIFGWAPLHGRGLQVALGYFLLPLTLIVVGRLLYRDRLTWWQWAAAGIAAVGVVFELFRVGGVSWETLVVCVGYPIYFVLRRQLGTGHLGGMFWDLVIVLPALLFFVVREIVATPALSENPLLWWLGPLYGLTTGLALILYLTASKLLSLSLFGLLSYLEPALLMVASLLNGERISAGEFVMYGAIWLAVLVITAGGAVQLLRSRGGRAG
ncbi:EamA family transporter RarD [Leucobacter sp. GX0328]